MLDFHKLHLSTFQPGT